MTQYKFAGPQEVVLPHQRALEGAQGTLVLTPGEEYDFGDTRPVGPAWWWDPQPPPEPEPELAAKDDVPRLVLTPGPVQDKPADDEPEG